MLSCRAENIIKDVDNVQKDIIDIKYLLQNYPDKFERDFIQKYIETKKSFFGNKITDLSFILALLAIVSTTILNYSLFLYSEYVQQYKFLYEYGLIIFIFFFVCLMIFYVKKHFEKNVFEDIIIAIEDDKLSIKEQGKSIVASEQGDISSNSNVDISSNNFKSGTNITDEKANQSGVQLKYHQILEEHRWITNLIWNKIHALIIVNGILFSAFNLLVIADTNSNFGIQKISLTIVGFLIT